MSAPTIRALEPADGSRGFFAVLAQLTEAPAVPPADFAELVARERRAGLRTTLVAVDVDGNVLATGAVLIEHKFIRGAAPCAHIEDIVVDKGSRGSQLGRRIIDALVAIAKEKGCYKAILDCADSNVGFYEKSGFLVKGTQMAMYF